MTPDACAGSELKERERDKEKGDESSGSSKSRVKAKSAGIHFPFAPHTCCMLFFLLVTINKSSSVP
jgi:hypothetical protein